MRETARLTAIAFQFLTRIPTPAIRVDEGDLRRASAAFPLVGLAVAAIAVAVRAAMEPLWGEAVATLAAVAAMVAATGAFHEDGLADSADGIWGGWDREQRIAIMRDSRLGTYGTVALLIVLSLRVALLVPLSLLDFARAVLAGAVLGRGSILLMVRLLPPAAPDGTGAAVTGPLRAGGSAVALVTVALAAVVASAVWAPLLLAVGVLVSLACAALLRRKLGGLTGDALGATNQLVELATIAVVAALVARGWPGLT